MWEWHNNLRIAYRSLQLLRRTVTRRVSWNRTKHRTQRRSFTIITLASHDHTRVSYYSINLEWTGRIRAIPYNSFLVCLASQIIGVWCWFRILINSGLVIFCRLQILRFRWKSSAKTETITFWTREFPMWSAVAQWQNAWLASKWARVQIPTILEYDNCCNLQESK